MGKVARVTIEATIENDKKSLDESVKAFSL